ncbi:MAG: preprotein translocase subunit SecG [Chlorobiaceae bacterium]|jgi:preprotein translocase subunit SecG|nr:preprotein translocase subunit SecG [Chlorobiaceae bacterium]
MHVFIVVLGLLASILLVGVILLQSPKSGSGLTGGISSLGTVQTLGVRRTGDFLSKITAILAGLVLLLCFVAQFTLPAREARLKTKSILQETAPVLPQTPIKQLPAAPAPLPLPAK